MRAVEAQRTLVKSVPELWAALSEVALLGPLLDDPFGEITITRLDPESCIEWQAQGASGVVELAATGFGTRVRVTAQIVEPEPAVVEPAPSPARARGLFGRLRRRRPAPAPPPPVAPEPQAPPIEAERATGALTSLLDEVGAARHRPFSRDAGGPAPIP